MHTERKQPHTYAVVSTGFVELSRWVCLCEKPLHNFTQLGDWGAITHGFA